MEKLYQYLWQHGMLGRRLTSYDGQEVKIIFPGVLNTDAGPDFQNARIFIGDTEWAGAVEIHVNASDWFKHNHHLDPVYDSVALHVVAIDDARVKRKNGDIIPQVAVTFPRSFYHLYALLSNNSPGVRCASIIPALSKLTITDWLESLCVERMQEKSSRILDQHRNIAGDWQQTCFITFARALGFGINAVPFEMMARSIPINFLARHSDSLFQIEAILFGQAGMLDSSINIFDEYYQNLCREYYFLARKYNLKPIRRELWKFARTRPGNFPHRRIAYLARFFNGGFSMLDKIIGNRENIDKIKDIFDIELSDYWISHQSFGCDSGNAPSALSKSSINLLMINLAAPLIYAHAAYYGDLESAEKAFDIWNELPAENNMYIRGWSAAGISPQNAAQSQALIHLRKSFCDSGKCLECRFGHACLRTSIK